MNKKVISSFLLFIGLMYLIMGCGGGAIPAAEFSKYIAAYTFGNLSVKSSFIVELQNEYRGTEKIGQEIANNLFEFSPKIAGKTYLRGNNKVEFVPDVPLKSNQKYKVKFHVSKALKAVEEKYNTFEYEVRTRKSKYHIELKGLKYEKSNGTTPIYNLEGTIFTSDFIEKNKIEEALETNLGKNLEHKIKWKHNPEGTRHEFSIPNIAAENTGTKVKVEVNEGIIGATGENEKDIAVPAKGTFAVHSIVVNRRENNKVSIYFTEKVKKDDLKGLILIGDESNEFSYEIDANIVHLYPNTDLSGNIKVWVLKGISSESGKKLLDDEYKLLKFGGFKPIAEIEGKGFYIVGDQTSPLVVKTQGLDQVQVEITKIYQKNVLFFLQNNDMDQNYNIKRFGKVVHKEVLKLNRKETFDPTQFTFHQLDLKKIVNMEAGAIYSVQLKFDRNMLSQKCNSSESGLLSFLKDVNSNETDDELYDEYYYDYYDYDYDNAENPCENSFYSSSRFPQKNIIASNIGLIAKKGVSNDLYLTTLDLSTAKPMSGVEVEVFSFQLVSLGKVSTNSEGMAKFEGKEKPFFVVASRGKEKSYVKLQNNSFLDVDMFEVDGSSSPSGIRGFVYGERGVWRPGDSIFLTLSLYSRGNTLPNDLPVMMELANPQGQIFDKQISNSGVNGFYTFTTYTAPSATTGNWTARFKVGNSIIEKTLKIETIKPNRMRILELNPKEILSNNVRLEYESVWLTGSPAKNLDAVVDVSWYKSKLSFKNYSQYNFNQFNSNFESIENVNVFTGKTDANGKFTYNLSFKQEEESSFEKPAVLNASLVTRVYEPSGEFSIQYDLKQFYPYSSYVGSYIAQEKQNSSFWWQGLNCGENYKLELVNILPNGQLRASNTLKIKVCKLNYDYWFNSYKGNSYYSDDNIKEVILEKNVNISGGRASVDIMVPKKKWGQYLIMVQDVGSGYKQCLTQYFDIPYESKTEEEKDNSTILPISMDRSEYSVNSQASVVINAPFSGNVLLSIENNTKVLSQKWQWVEKGKNNIPLTISAEMAPNCYANIMLIQPQPKTTNKLPLRMYGIVPIFVNNMNSVLYPQISAPAEIKPETNLTVNVSEKNGRPMTYTLAVVDEGLLGISNFKTPNPWKFFNAKEALGVKTWDMLNDVLGAFSGVFENMFSIGGDEELKAINNGKMKRFDPVVKFIGPFQLTAGSTKSHTIAIPNYVGNVKIMVVAGDGKGAFGQGEADVLVSKAVMLLATFPRMISPQEEIELPVNVFSTSAGNVNVNIAPNDLFEVIGNKSQQVNFSSPGDKIVSFKLKVKDKIGLANVKILAEGNGERAEYNLEVPVRLPNPPTTRRREIIVKPGEEIKIEADAFGIESTREVTLQVSGMQSLNFSGKMDELIRYPYGCLEQTTSAAFPQLFIGKMTTLQPDQANEISGNIKNTIERFKSYQASGGGFSYWPGNGNYNHWVTAYVLHFLIEAEKQGYQNTGMLASGLVTLKKDVNQFEASKFRHPHDLNTQAYKLYVLALAQKSEIGAMNRLKELELPTSAKIKLALAYIYNGNHTAAKEIMQNIQIEGYIDGMHTYSSGLLDQAYLLEYYIATKNQADAFKQYNYIVEKLNLQSFLGTQNTAYMLKTLAEYSAAFPNKSLNFKGNNGNMPIEGNSAKSFYQFTLKNPNSATTFKNTGDAPIYVSVNTTAVLSGVDSAKPSKNLGMQVKFFNRAGAQVDLSNIEKQTDIFAEITITNPSKNEIIPNLALTLMVPSGWEILNNRIALSNEDFELGKVDHMDVRDDRIFYFFSLKAGESKKITQALNASYEGKYFLPAIKCEAMYNSNIYAYQRGGITRVVR